MNQIFISSLSLENLFSSNDLSPATGYRYIKIIDDILAPLQANFWQYEKGMASLNESELKIFQIFLETVRKHNVKFAKKQLIQELRNNGYTIEQNNQQNRTNYNKGTARNEQSNTTKQPNFYETLLGL